MSESAGALDGDEVVVLWDDTAADDATRSALVGRLLADPDLDAVGQLVPVVDAVKRVSATGVVEAAVDRDGLVILGRPLAVRRRVLDPASGQPRPRRVAEL